MEKNDDRPPLEERLAEKLIEAIVDGGLIHCRCARNRRHNCVVVWGQNAREQIGAMIRGFAQDLDRHRSTGSEL